MKKSRLLGAVCTCVVFVTGIVNAASVAEIEANDSILTAQNLDAYFDLSFNVNINDAINTNTSTNIPHAEVQGTGNGTVDYFSFTAPKGATVILDIDCGSQSTATCTSSGNFDSFIRLYTPSSTIDSFNDDSTFVDTGSAEYSTSGRSTDSFIQQTTSTGGLWRVAVGTYPNLSPVPSGSDYILNVSVTAVPIPPALWLFGSGLLGLVGMARRKAA